MGFCSNCGARLDEDSDYCAECGEKIDFVDTKGTQDTQTNYVGTSQNYQSNSYSAVPQESFVTLSENEIKIKTYHCTTLKRPRGEGYLTVTNKRVVFHGHGSSGGGRSKLVSEVPIETVSGISAYYGYGFNILLLVLGIIFSLGFLYSLESRYSRGYFFIPLIIAIICFIFCRKPSYNLSVFSSGANGSPINIGAGEFGSKITGQGAVFSIAALPTDETEKMMNEIGAIVLDLKELGDHAIDKWLGKAQRVQSNVYKKQNSTSGASDEEFFK